jgi:magnesium transporter
MSTRKQRRKKHKRPGLAPGTLQFTGEQHVDAPVVLQVRYNETDLSQRSISNGMEPKTAPGAISWFDVRGLHDVELIDLFGKHFNIHPLVLEDVLNTQQRPKFEEYDDEVFIIVSSLSFDAASLELHTEQIAIYFGENYLLTFQENPDDTFTAVRERIEAGKGRIRSRKSDYLAYALIDNVVDNYFIVLNQIEDAMEVLEEEISRKPTHTTKEKIYRLKIQLLALRKAVSPLREAVSKFTRCESKLVDTSTGIFVRDLYDHVIRIYDLVETYRDLINGLQELYHSELSLRMNTVIQVLTIITTIFVPLTFLAGIYGMNFDNMPELHWENGYFYLLGLMSLITVLLFIFFKRKRWI